jgi:hypothetical protein
LTPSDGAGPLSARLARLAPKVATLGAYGYQAAAALGLVLAVAHVLSAAEYARFSLTLATAQFAAIGAFEWVRIAASRFYPGPDPERAPLQKASLGAGFLGSAAIGVLVSLGAMLGGAPVSVVLLGAAIAVGQGLTDLYLTFVRFRGDLGAFARLQSLRATAMIGFAVGGALLTASATGALAGIVLAHAALAAVALVTDQHLHATPWRRPSLELVKAQVAYGAPAAGASILYLATTLIARFAISFAAPGAAGAGALLAFDLLQRPFAVVTTAFHALLYPPVVRAYDRGGFKEAGPAIRRLYLIEVGLIGALSAGLLAVFAWPAAVRIVVPETLMATFSASAGFATLLFAIRTITANLVPIQLHLMHRGSEILKIALLDVPLFWAIYGGINALYATSAANGLLALLSSSLAVMIAGAISSYCVQAGIRPLPQAGSR